MQICEPRTASESWNTDNWCWLDWVGAGMLAVLALMTLAFLIICARIVMDLR